MVVKSGLLFTALSNNLGLVCRSSSTFDTTVTVGLTLSFLRTLATIILILPFGTGLPTGEPSALKKLPSESSNDENSCSSDRLRLSIACSFCLAISSSCSFSRSAALSLAALCCVLRSFNCS